MTGARPNSDERFMATPVQPATTSSACSPSATCRRSSKRRARVRAYPWSGPGLPNLAPCGCPPRRSAGRSAFQCPGAGIGSLRRGTSFSETGTYSGAATACFLVGVVKQAEDDRVAQRLPRRFDDVVRHSDRRPRPLAVRTVDEHACHRARALGRVQYTDLVVGEVDAFEDREPSADAGPKCPVQGVDRTIAFGGCDLSFAADVDLDGGLGGERPVADLVGDHAERLEAEEVLLPAGRPAQQQFQRAVRRFEVIALVLETLEL